MMAQVLIPDMNEAQRFLDLLEPGGTYFVDQDKGSTELLFSSAQPADILVESSHGKFHGYWLTGNAPLKSFAQRMHALADKFDGDHNICNLGRVMRLPGFIHHKGEQFMSRIAKIREEL
jgi:hypothetical protein